LEQSSDEEVCICDRRSEVDVSNSGVSSVINSDNEEIEEETMGDARAKWP
jgi:hypothetical protein